MARPPEPLTMLLPFADVVLDAEVVRVLDERDDAPSISGAPGDADLGVEAGSQIVQLRARAVLKGDLPPGTLRDGDIAGGELTVEKPIAPYVLQAGISGPFLLARRDDGPLVIIGRYGPRFYEVDEVRRALDLPGEDPAAAAPHQSRRGPRPGGEATRVPKDSPPKEQS